MRTVAEALIVSGQTCHVAKKGKKYICERNGELGLTTDPDRALAFESEAQLTEFISNVIIDTRNAQVIGRIYTHTTLTKR